MTGQIGPMPILSTCRIQLRKEFPFAACAALADRLAALGISHVYASPILTARAGSAHGYDVVRYDEINPELGGEAGFRAMSAALRARGIGIILDVVPNHMSVGGGDNPNWLDCLRAGRNSRFARWFDIDFDNGDPTLAGKIHAPFLGAPLARVLEECSLQLSQDEETGEYVILYGEHVFPIRQEDQQLVARQGMAATSRPDQLKALLARQHFVLDSWRSAGDRINWRRFFDITQLAAVRMEEPEAFAAAHAIALGLYREGLIDGLRVDHIDGLSDPTGYCQDLRRELDGLQPLRPAPLDKQRAWLIVEKILAVGEHLPAEWDADGTTGYDFMDQVSAVQHDPAAGPTLARHWSALSGRSDDFETEETAARREVLDLGFDAQRERLMDALLVAAGQEAEARGVTRAALRRAASAMLAAMRAYRSYATGEPDELHCPTLNDALDRALASPTADEAALELIRDIVNGRLGPTDARAAALLRFSQLSAPLAAKAVEDTSFYRFGRLLSRNDVGFDASTLGEGPARFHEEMADRAGRNPRSMLATATHDHKRGEDVRARLAVISEIPESWIAASLRWRDMNAELLPKALHAADEYMFYQMLVGAWPLALETDDTAGLVELAERLGAWWIKALREAKLRSSWTRPSTEAEEGAVTFARAVLDPVRSAAFLQEAKAFVDTIARPGAANGLVQMALRCLAPGIPDLYQGTEFWDFSLVDPDNRRAVDHATRGAALKANAAWQAQLASWRDGHLKQTLLANLLHLRQRLPALFLTGNYTPLEVIGPKRDKLLAFARCDDSHLVIAFVLRCGAEGIVLGEGLTPPAAWWGDTHVMLPVSLSGLRAVIGPERQGSHSLTDKRTIAVAEALDDLPFAVWASARR